MKSISNLKKLPLSQRPRERLEQFGVSNLNNLELLALILTSGNKKQSILKLANQILNKFDIKALQNIQYQQLLAIAGIGQVKAAQLLACLELGKRIYQQSNINKIGNPQIVYQLAKKICHKNQEHTLAFYLNARQELICQELIAVGGLNYNFLEPKTVFAKALILPSSYIILVHNHPSGDVKPSDDDIKITRQLIQAGNLLGIKILDHLIVSPKEYFSFREANLLEL